MSYGSDAKASWLQAVPWYPDEYAKDEGLHADMTKNSGFAARYVLTGKSLEFEACDRLHSECFTTAKLLLPNVKIDIQLYLNSPEFYLHSDVSEAAYKLKLVRACLILRRVEISSSVRMAHLKVFLRTRYSY